MFWVVRPEISTQEISGLGTVLSGPVIDTIAGTARKETNFRGVEKPPSPPVKDELSIVLKSPKAQQLRTDSPVYFRGIEVGVIRDVQLADDSGSVEMQVLIDRRYAPLVREHSEFWVVSAVDFKGGIFSGVQLKVESLRAMMSGGVAFATPEEKMGQQMREWHGISRPHDNPRPEWLTWSAKIALDPDPVVGDQHRPVPEPRSRNSRDSIRPWAQNDG